jgi:EAL domain-containing protein (putative c-di-GMP-specific phosphodiesterase class I)/GGDEF domain-containing protein
MMAALINVDERQRLAELHRFNLLDTPPDPVLDELTNLAALIFKTPIALVSLVDETRQWFKSKHGLTQPEISREDAFCAHAIGQPGVMVVEDATKDPRFSENPLVLGEPSIRFYAGAPLITEQGSALGTLCIMDQAPRRRFSRAQQEILHRMAALAMRQLADRRRIIDTDAVTGLPNRNRFLKEIEISIANLEIRHNTFSVVIIDASEPIAYSQMIRVLGPTHAEAILVTVAKILKVILPEGTMLFHIGLYRFAFLHKVPTIAETASLLPEIAASFREPIMCGGIPVAASTAIGVAQFPGDSDSANGLVHAAVAAAHYARARKMEWARFDSSTAHADERNFRLLTDLRAALATEGQLIIHYQPKVSLQDGACVGAEALIRWQHPELGPISPGEFIPLAETTALMKPLTEWVLASVCDQISRWQAAGVDLKISVNISIHNLEDPHFLRGVKLTLARNGIKAANLDFEITEGGISKDVESLGQTLQEIRAFGITISIDDFGTGESALGYLQHIPADILKIDQSFVRLLDSHEKDQILVRSTIDLAHALGVRVVAEGIETEEIYNILQGFGCDEGQGYFIARPVEGAAFFDWLGKRT